MGVRAVGVALALLALLGGCRERTAPAPSGKLRVAASIFPLADVAARIGGDDANVVMLLRAGESPHDYEPTPDNARQVAQADVIVLVGMGIDDWAVRSGQPTGHARILRVTEGDGFRRALAGAETQTAPTISAGRSQRVEVPGLDDSEHNSGNDAHAGEHHAHGGRDPHVWLDPVLMQTIVREIAEAFAQADPVRADAYCRRADGYIQELRQLDHDYRQTLAAVAQRHFVSFHKAFSYMARRYGLDQIALNNVEAADFGPDQLRKVVDYIRENRVKVIFAERQFPADKLQRLRDLTGATVGTLDPEGNPQVPGYDSYMAMMRSNLKALAEALK